MKTIIEFLDPPKPKWQLPPLKYLLPAVLIMLALIIFFTVRAGASDFSEYSDEQIVNAIYHAEGGAKAQFAYGIRSIPYRTIQDARRICFNSVRNGRARWIKASRPYDLITYIGLRYCPPTVHRLNSNWVSNVKFYLASIEADVF